MIRSHISIVVSLFLLLSLILPGGVIADPVSSALSISGTNLGFNDGRSRMIGWQFTVGNSAIAVTELGFHDFGGDGLLESHEVGIWRLSDQALMGSAVVPSGTSGTLDNLFRYAPLSTSTILDAGTSYVISGFDNGIDPHVWDVEIAGFPNRSVTGFSVDPAIALGSSGTAHGPLQSTFGRRPSAIPFELVNVNVGGDGVA